MLEIIVFIAHACSTLMWFGIMWFVHLVHYPLFRLIGKRNFLSYEKEHYRRTMPLAVCLLAIELVTGILLFWIRPAEIPFTPVVLGAILLGVIWLFTWKQCVPLHKQLISGKAGAYKRLIRANLIRTVAWSLRAAVIIWMLVLMFH